jgi:Lar family restriction alleviation protein
VEENMNDLLPCPFCGGLANYDFEVNDPDNVIWTDWEVYCMDCFASIRAPEQKTAKDNWNKRTIYVGGL